VVCIHSKALAKYFGGYRKLHEGHDDGLFYLTGKPSSSVKLLDENAQEQMNSYRNRKYPTELAFKQHGWTIQTFDNDHVTIFNPHNASVQNDYLRKLFVKTKTDLSDYQPIKDHDGKVVHGMVKVTWDALRSMMLIFKADGCTDSFEVLFNLTDYQVIHRG